MSVLSAQSEEVEAVEQFSRRRWLVIILFTLAYLVFAAVWIPRLLDADASNGTSSRVAAGGITWLLYGVVVTVWTFGRGGRRWSPRQRLILNDEMVAADRATAIRVGYALLLAGLTALTAAVTAGVARRDDLLRVGPALLVTLGVAVPALVFSILQLRAGAAADVAE